VVHESPDLNELALADIAHERISDDPAWLPWREADLMARLSTTFAIGAQAGGFGLN
jgi:hypothetical protein